MFVIQHSYRRDTELVEQLFCGYTSGVHQVREIVTGVNSGINEWTIQFEGNKYQYSTYPDNHNVHHYLSQYGFLVNGVSSTDVELRQYVMSKASRGGYVNNSGSYNNYYACILVMVEE